jgi:hypothetical protein
MHHLLSLNKICGFDSVTRGVSVCRESEWYSGPHNSRRLGDEEQNKIEVGVIHIDGALSCLAQVLAGGLPALLFELFPYNWTWLHES